ncbi:MAG: M4 family metallopeptidase [Chloroflexota bacterium]
MHSNHRFLRLALTILMGMALLSIAAQPAFAGSAPAPAAQDLGERRGYHPQTGMLTFLGASPAEPIVVAGAVGPDLPAEARGEAILQAYAAEFGIQDPVEELTVSRQSVSPMTENQSVRYQQVYQGVPILGGELVLNMTAAGELLSLSGEVSPNLSLSTTPQLSADAARAAALELVAKYYELEASDLSVTDPELWIYDERLLMPSDRPTQLVWRMDVTAAGAPVRQLVLIEANSGKVSLTFNQVDTAWVGSGAYNAPASGQPASEAPSAALVLGTPSLATYDLNGDEPASGPITGYTPECSNSSRTCGTLDTDTELAHAYAYDTYMAYADLHSRDSIDGAGMTILSYVHYGVGYQNAFWSGYEMVYGDGFSAADDVVGHELTHGVTQNESNLFYWYQSGAINESFSDVWGEYVDQINGYGTDTPAVEWLMGEDVPGFGAIRNMKNPPAFGDPDSMLSAYYYEGTSDNGGVHWNSGVNNKAVFLMVDGGSFGGKVVSPLGWDKTLTVYYEAQTSLLTSASDYLDLYNALYQACLNSIGVNGIVLADCQEVRDATDAVKMSQQPAPNFNPDAAYCPTGTSPYPDLFVEDFETGTDGWTFDYNQGTAANWSLWSSSPWYPYLGPYATSGDESLYADDDAGYFNNYTLNDSYAISPSINLPQGKKLFLHFRHSYGFEFYSSYLYDGAVLEYSLDGGAWTDAKPLFSAGQNYKGMLYYWAFAPNPLHGRQAFANFSHGYVDSRYDLTKLVTTAPHNIRFRWRMGTDGSGAAWGWWLDDVRVETCISIPSVPALLSPALNALVTDYTPLLDWKDSIPDLDHYWLQVDDNSDFSSPHFDANVGPTSQWQILDPNALNSNTKYYWRVKAYNAGGGAGNWSAVRYFRTSILPPANLIEPSGNILNKRPFFDWDAVPGATGYTLQVSRESDFTPLLWNRNSTTDSYMPTTDLPADTLLYWRVRTSGPNGPSAWSDQTFSFTTGNPPSIPVLLSPANNSLHTDYTVPLDWRPSTFPTGTSLGYYEVQVDDDPAFGSLAYNIGVGGDFIETDPLAPGVKYYWRVRAFNLDSEYSAWSTVRYFRTAFLPPNLVSPADGALLLNLRPTFDWDPVSGATNYTLQVSKNTAFTQLVLNKVVTPDTYTPTVNLPAGIPLYWRVRTNGAFGPGAYSPYRTLTASSPGGDDDGDSLPNDWEINGYDANGDSIIDVNLPALGADYRHKDIFVEMDYMANTCYSGGVPHNLGLAPNMSVMAAIESVFANAPVTNPDGTTGINIHLELDDLVACDGDLNPVWTDFFAIKAANFDSNRTAVYHYMIWANAYSGGQSSGLAQLPGTDFIVTLGSWNNGGGTDPQKIGTFIHELGHNLNLTHGGSDHNNYKPNYLSVMNYFFQTIGLYRDSHWGEEGPSYYDNFDYQRINSVSLNENALKESLGLNNPAASNYGTYYFCPGAVDQWDRTPVLVASPIDWNCDGDTLDTAVVDINFSGGRGTLTAQNNWLNITFDGFGVIGSGLSPDQLSVLAMSNTNAEYDELTWEIQQQVDLLRSQP